MRRVLAGWQSSSRNRADPVPEARAGEGPKPGFFTVAREAHRAKSDNGLKCRLFFRLRFLMNDEPPGVMVTFNPGTEFGFNVADELIFDIRVVSDSDREYFMGPASRNPDNVIHAGVDDLGGGVFNVDM